MEVSPLGYLIRIDGSALKNHHTWVPQDAPDGYYGCLQRVEVILYDKNGNVLEPDPDQGRLGGCSGGGEVPTEPGILYVSQTYTNLLDLDAVDHIEICGVDIPLH